MIRKLISWAVFAALAVAGAASAGAQPAAWDDLATTAAAHQGRALKIAYLRAGLEVSLPTTALDALAPYLEADAGLRTQMRQAGLARVLIYQIDSFQDMLDRLNHREFDAAYCPAKILVEQSGGYVPILQLRPPHVIADTTHSRMIAWRGVIIGSKAAPPFADDAAGLDDAGLTAYIRESRMAFPSAHSAVGYIYPLLTLRRRFDVDQPAGYTFMGSSQEVARAVINGLIPLGACEEGALEEVVGQIPPVDGQPWRVDQVVKILAHTPPAPTDPIIAHADLAPARSALGQALRDALRRYHEARADLPPVGESAPEHFNQLREDLLLFRQSDTLTGTND